MGLVLDSFNLFHLQPFCISEKHLVFIVFYLFLKQHFFQFEDISPVLFL